MGVIVSRHVGTKKDLRSYLKSLEGMTKFEICHVSNFKSWDKPGISCSDVILYRNLIKLLG